MAEWAAFVNGDTMEGIGVCNEATMRVGEVGMPVIGGGLFFLGPNLRT